MLWLELGGEGQTPRPTDPGDSQEARPRKRRGPGVMYPSDEELAEHAKQVVDGLPPLTDEQREALALIFRSKPRGSCRVRLMPATLPPNQESCRGLLGGGEAFS